MDIEIPERPRGISPKHLRPGDTFLDEHQLLWMVCQEAEGEVPREGVLRVVRLADGQLGSIGWDHEVFPAPATAKVMARPEGGGG